MGKERHAVDSGDCSSDNENADEVEEEPSEVDPEEEPVDEDPFEQEPVEADPSEEEPDEEDPCEEEPDEEDPCEEEPSEEGSCEEEPDEDPYDESNVESLHEQELSEVQCEEEPNRQASCEEAVNEDHSCESSRKDETNVEPCEEGTHEEQYEIEISEDSEPEEEEYEEYEEYEEQCEEEPSEEPSEEAPSEPGEPSGDDRYARQSNPEKKNMSADAVSGQKVSIGSSSINPLETPQNISNNVMAPQKLDNAKDTGKKRCSRWDVKTVSNGTADGGIDVSKKKRKSRWSSDDSQLNNTVVVSDHDIAFCQEVVKLHAQLYEITQKLQSREVVDERPDGERSPSPPPIYKNLGIKISLREARLREKLKLHSREARLREKLKLQRQSIIAELIQKNPNYIPPPDYKRPKKSKKSRRPMCPSPTPTPNSKFYKKLYIPSKEYPEYNFVGLIIGPRGNTQKRMEEETGAKICLRGKGSEMERKGRQRVPKPSDDDDLHVLVEAGSQDSLDAAVAMVEKLLVPVEDERNVHKLVQLRELATLNGNLRSKVSINSGKLCDVCGDATHSTSACPLTASDPGANTNEQDANFLSELRGAFSAFSAPEVPSSCIHSVANIASASSKPKKEIDNTTLYVGCLPHSVDKKDKLVKLFSPFGQICKSRVIRNKKNGPRSSNYGFVKYFDHIKATMAVTQMNGYKIDGKVLVVRKAGTLMPPDKPNTGAGGMFNPNQLPQYPGYAAIAHSNPGPMCWPCPPGSVPPESAVSFVSNSVYDNHFHGQASASLGPFCQPPPLSTLLPRDVAPSDELAHFPGYLKSLGPPSQLLQASQTTYLSSSQVHFTPKFSNPHMPPP